MGASVACVYAANHRASEDAKSVRLFPVSTTVYCGLLFLIYVTGIIPPNPFFPPIFHRGNVFAILYRLYCSEVIGYQVLRRVLHQPVTYPHSDCRNGIRCLDSRAGLAVTRQPLAGTKMKAAAMKHEDSEDADWEWFMHYIKQFQNIGGGVVDLLQISAANRRGIVVVPMAIFKDNYAYLILSLRTEKAAAVDPADPEVVLRVLASLNRKTGKTFILTDILTTHKHWDHAGGNRALLNYAKSSSLKTGGGEERQLVDANLRVIGSDIDRPMGCEFLVNDSTPPFEIAGGDVLVQAMAAPGHTKGSLLFVVGSADPAVVQEAAAGEGSPQRVAVFTGDSLFCGGCGAMFEMDSVNDVQQARRCFLDDPRMLTHPATKQKVADVDVLIYFGHEYTEQLLAQVSTIAENLLAHPSTCSEENQRYARNLKCYLAATRELRLPATMPPATLPSTLALEKRINPLLTVSGEVLNFLGNASVGRDGPVDMKAVEEAIYCTDKRILPS